MSYEKQCTLVQNNVRFDKNMVMEEKRIMYYIKAVIALKRLVMHLVKRLVDWNDEISSFTKQLHNQLTKWFC